MEREEKQLVERILQKTKKGEINWKYARTTWTDKFTAEIEIDGMVLILERRGLTYATYYLEIKTSEISICLKKNESCFGGPMESLWGLLCTKQEQRMALERSQLFLRFNDLLRNQ